MANSTLSVPKKMPSPAGLNVLSPAPSLLSLRSVIDFMPGDIRIRYKDAARYLIWPECPLDSRGIADELNEDDEFRGSTSRLFGPKLKRNATLRNGLSPGEYSKFGNAPVVLTPAMKPPSGRTRKLSETISGSASFSSLRPRNPLKAAPAGMSVAYFSSKDGGDVDIRLLSTEMTRL